MCATRVRSWFVLLLIGAFFTLSMAEAVAMPQALAGQPAGMSGMDMPDCADMKMPVPCKDPNTLCLGAICIPTINFFAAAPTALIERAWTRSVYDGRLLVVLEGRAIAPALEPPILSV
jgi:hypothetical protein